MLDPSHCSPGGSPGCPAPALGPPALQLSHSLAPVFAQPPWTSHGPQPLLSPCTVPPGPCLDSSCRRDIIRNVNYLLSLKALFAALLFSAYLSAPCCL